MQTRSKLILLITVGLILFILGAWLIYQTFKVTAGGVEQTGNLPAATENLPNGQGKTSQTTPTTSAPVAPVDSQLRTLEDNARASAERIGSGSSQTGFLGYSDALNAVTPELRAWILDEQKKMVAAHPANGPLYTLSTRAVASHAVDSAFGDPRVSVSVQAIQTDNLKTTGQAKQINIVFVKQPDGTYLMGSMEWKDLEL
jgi:hypothetical protein